MQICHAECVLSSEQVRSAPPDVLRTNAVRRRFAVGDLGLRYYPHAIAVFPSTPTKIDVVAKDGEDLAHSVEGLPHVAADEHAGGSDGEHFLGLRVLTLIAFTTFDAGITMTCAGQRKSDFLQSRRIVPAHRLHPEDAAVGVRLRRP